MARVGREAGKRVSICGEIAGDPSLTPLLVGLGVTGLSMIPTSIPLAKAVISEFTILLDRQIPRKTRLRKHHPLGTERAVRASVRIETRDISAILDLGYTVVFKIDLETCPRCGGKTKIVAAVLQPNAIWEILGHLGLPTTPPAIATARAPPQGEWDFLRSGDTILNSV